MRWAPSAAWSFVATCIQITSFLILSDDRALRATSQKVPDNEAALVSRRLSAHEAPELLRLWMRHVATSKQRPLHVEKGSGRHRRWPDGLPDTRSFGPMDRSR